MVLHCLQKKQAADRAENGAKVFFKYVDDIVRTVKGDAGLVLLG